MANLITTVNGRESSEYPQASTRIGSCPGEQDLLELFRSALQTEQCGPDDDFFDLGGDSFLMVDLLSQIETAAGIRVPNAVFLGHPTVRGLASFLHGDQPAEALPPCVLPLFEHNSGSKLFCIPGAGGNVRWFRDLVLTASLDRTVYGLETQALSEEIHANFSIPRVAAEFVRAVRKVQPTGPYLFCGYSMGGLIAFECATILLREGETVAPLLLIDTYVKSGGLHPGARAIFVLKTLFRMSWQARGVWLADKFHWLRHAWKTRIQPKSSPHHEQNQKDAELAKGDEYRLAGICPRELSVILFAARDSSRKFTSTPDHGWASYALNGCQVLEIPGNHYTMLAHPQVDVLAGEIRKVVMGFATAPSGRQ